MLLSCKLQDGMETDTRNQKLIDLKNRGGLWKVNISTTNVFTIAESYFLSATKDFVSKIDAKHIVSELVKDPGLLSLDFNFSIIFVPLTVLTFIFLFYCNGYIWYNKLFYNVKSEYFFLTINIEETQHSINNL